MTASTTSSGRRRLRLGVLCLALLLVAAAAVQQVSMVTMGWDGQQTDGLSRHFSVARNGNLVSLMSEATNLVSGDTNGYRDVFVIDRKRGQTLRASVSSEGLQANGESGSGGMPEHGRFIVFHSVADNLVPGDTTRLYNDVFVHDLETRQTRRITVGWDGSEADGGSAWPAVSGNGRYIAYRSGATNLVPDDTNGVADVFLYDMKQGTTTRVTLTAAGGEIDDHAIRHSLSSNGRYVAVSTAATNILPGDSNGFPNVYVYDLKKGTVTLVSRGLGGEPADGGSLQPSLSRNGRWVAFPSYASNLVSGDGNGVMDVFVFDMKKSVMERCSVDSLGHEGDGDCYVTAFARHGRILYFDSVATNLVPGDTNGARDVFVHDRRTASTRRVSLASDGSEADGDSLRPRPTPNGKRLAIFSSAANLVEGDANGVSDVFIIEP